MNGKLFYIVALTLSVIIAVTSCGNDNKSKYYNPKVEELDETPDSAVFVRLDDIAHDSLFVTLLNNGEKKVYGFSEALAAGQIKGTLTKGNEFSLFPQSKKRNISIAINVTELQGRWYYEMSHLRGFDFGPYGALSAVNNATISFREWKLLNGKLYLYYVDVQQASSDRHEYAVEEAEIISLTSENMQLFFRGETLNCQRQRQVVKFGK